jgi:hypothetical protein
MSKYLLRLASNSLITKILGLNTTTKNSGLTTCIHSSLLLEAVDTRHLRLCFSSA